MKKDTGVGDYPFEWLDQMISVKLNSERISLETISEAELSKAEEQLSFKTWELLNYLKVKTFGRSEKKVRAFVMQYHETILSLIAQAKRNLINQNQAQVVVLSEKMITALQELQRDVEERYEKYLHKPRPEHAAENETMGFKVLCQLSVDQLGILLKAADDIKLILSRSLSLIFRSLVPFLSTQRIKNISWMSMRKSTYQFEKSDLDFVVDVLERLIKKVKGYY